MMSEDHNKKQFVLATSHSWSQGMVERLSARTGCNFTLISEPSELTSEKLAVINPMFVFFTHWSHRIPANIFNKFDCVIFHMTDLPFGRGGSPLQNLIVRGIYETQISALRCVEEIDAGPVYLKKPLSLHGSAEEIFLRASNVIEEMIVTIIEKSPEPVSQEGTPTTFKRRKPEEGNLDNAKSLDQAFDFIRMLDADGYPKAFVNVGPFKLEFARASRKTGHVVADVRISLADGDALKEKDSQ